MAARVYRGRLRILSDDVSGSCIGSGSRGVTEDVCVVRVSHAAAAVGSGIAFWGLPGCPAVRFGVVLLCTVGCDHVATR